MPTSTHRVFELFNKKRRNYDTKFRLITFDATTQNPHFDLSISPCCERN